MQGYRESPDQNYVGWYEVESDKIVVWLKKSGIADAHKVVTHDWSYATAQTLIDDFVATGRYPDYPQNQ